MDLEQDLGRLTECRERECGRDPGHRRREAVDQAAERPAAGDAHHEKRDRGHDSDDETQAGTERRDRHNEPEDGEVARHRWIVTLP